ncbi:hypothetical protein DFH06DRAFT_1323314 [Mycena polygramma]|nr:hypothetical protein DFH06DRAFT_1323314 [Mycena polygramma]
MSFFVRAWLLYLLHSHALLWTPDVLHPMARALYRSMLAAATKTIKILCIDFRGAPCIGALDISSSSLLRVCRGPHSGNVQCALVSTIPPIHLIRTIVIPVRLDRGTCDALDAALSTLHISVEFVDGACRCATDSNRVSDPLRVNMGSFDWCEYVRMLDPLNPLLAPI